MQQSARISHGLGTVLPSRAQPLRCSASLIASRPAAVSRPELAALPQPRRNVISVVCNSAVAAAVPIAQPDDAQPVGRGM